MEIINDINLIHKEILKKVKLTCKIKTIQTKTTSPDIIKSLGTTFLER